MLGASIVVSIFFFYFMAIFHFERGMGFIIPIYTYISFIPKLLVRIYFYRKLSQFGEEKKQEELSEKIDN